MSAVSEKIVKFLMYNEIISAEDKELYVYGFHQGFTILANILTTIAIGFFFNMVIESIIFIAAYIPLRSYAGGYHAKTPVRCYLISVGMIAIALSVISLPFWTALIVVAIVLISVGTIITLAPVADFNKPLDQVEKVVYRKRTRIILSILVLLALVFWVIGYSFVSVSITVAIAMLAVMLLLGKAKDKVSMSA